MNNICPICGNYIQPHTEVIVEDSDYVFCSNCRTLVYSCRTCDHVDKCKLKEYPEADLYITVQGLLFGKVPVTAKQYNPEVLDRVCPTCNCGSPWNCQRIHTCSNWEINKVLKRKNNE